MIRIAHLMAIVGLVLLGASPGVLGAVVGLPDTSNTMTCTATVAAQCDVVALPSSVSFTVNNIANGAASSAATVTISNIALADGKALRLSLQANAAGFTAPTGGTVTWAAGDISWNAATWTNGTGNAAALSDSSYTAVVTSGANAASLSCADLVFTLAGKNTVDRSGSHTLAATWKIESI